MRRTRTCARSSRIEFGDGVLGVSAKRLHEAASDLKELGFDRLGMVTAVDYGEEFEIVYRLQSRDMHAGDLPEGPYQARQACHRVGMRSVAGCQLAGARGLRPVRDRLRGASRSAQDPAAPMTGWAIRSARTIDDDRIIRRPDYI